MKEETGRQILAALALLLLAIFAGALLLHFVPPYVLTTEGYRYQMHQDLTDLLATTRNESAAQTKLLKQLVRGQEKLIKLLLMKRVG